MPVSFETARSGADTFFAPQLPEHSSAHLLLNHQTQSATTVNGWGSVIFGIPFMAMGVVALLELPGARMQPHWRGSDWLAGVILGLFFFAGLFFVAHGVRGVIGKAIWRRQAAGRPNEPWLYDHHWRREGVAFSAFDDMVKRLLAAIVWTSIWVPFAWVGITERGAWPFLVAVAVFGLLGLMLWYRWAQMLFDFLRYGNSFLTYDQFPYSLGGTLSARLRIPRDTSAIEELTLTLRCVEERYVTSGTGRNPTSNVLCYELYGESVRLGRDGLNGLLAGEIPVQFQIPADPPATSLISSPPTYWEVEAKGKAQGARYEAVFLVPVYKTS